jgi:hypothetical protein
MTMRITAAEVMEKRAYPGQPGGGQPAQPRPRPAGPMAPQAPEPDPQSGAGDPAVQAAPEDPTQQSAMGEGGAELQKITQALLGDMFNDDKIAQASDLIQKAIPIVGPEHAEKFVKVYSDWVKAHMVMKANLLAMVVMATPQQMMQNQVQQMMQQLQQGAAPQGPQPLKVPIT